MKFKKKNWGEGVRSGWGGGGGVRVELKFMRNFKINLFFLGGGGGGGSGWM